MIQALPKQQRNQEIFLDDVLFGVQNDEWDYPSAWEREVAPGEGRESAQEELRALGDLTGVQHGEQWQVPTEEDRAHAVWTLGDGWNHFVSVSTVTPNGCHISKGGFAAMVRELVKTKAVVLTSSATLKLQKRGWR